MNIEAKKEKKAKELETKERCVLCKKLTDVDKNTPVGMRRGYVEGVGQLCPKCDGEVYKD